VDIWCDEKEKYVLKERLMQTVQIKLNDKY